MARKWTKKEEVQKKKELFEFYIKQNKSISQIAKILNVGESTVYDRLLRLNIPINRKNKEGYNNIRNDIFLPKKYSKDLAEFVGILLGDGHITPTQVTVTLGKKENQFVEYVMNLMEKLFHVKPKKIITKRNDFVVYMGSTKLVRWFLEMGMVSNKVKHQVDFPSWIFNNDEFMKRALRGFFDTDGSVYKLKYGIQFSYCNKSVPLLKSTQKMLLELGYFPSRVSNEKNVYLTRKLDLFRYCKEIGFGNKKHEKRFTQCIMGVSHSGNCS